MSALDLDALERLTRAYADAHAAMLADDRSAQAWLDDEAASKALAAHYGGQWASPAQCVDVLALITRLRAAEARTAWQPIETAPVGVWVHVAWLGKTGWHDARRDLWDPEQRASILALQAAVGRPDIDPEWWVADGGSDGEGGYATTAPTHWRHGPTEWTGEPLRAAEARTAWQPIASVPIGETVMLWTPVRRVHVGHVTTLAWCEYTHWMPLPAAPEAP